MLRHLHEVLAGLQQLLGKRAREHRIGIGIVLRQTIERGPAGPAENREHAFRQLRHRHMLFEMAGKSFSQTVTEQRPAQSRRLLREARSG
jgi:hypothetical protein